MNKDRFALLIASILLGLTLILFGVLAWSPAVAHAQPEPGDGQQSLQMPMPPQVELEILNLPVGFDAGAAVRDEPDAPWAIGFVFYDGVPVSGASATLESRHGSLAVTTQPGPLSIYPYFTATLSTTPLEAELGDLVELEVSYSGETNFTSFMVMSGTLHWNPTQDTPFDGYLVYYEPVANGYPYTGTGAAEGDSPIYVGDVTSYALTNLPGGTYHLAVTARDQDADGENDQTEGHESWFSDPATAEILGPPEADFGAAPTGGVAPLTVDFTNTSDGYYQTSLWDFGDGLTSTLDSPTHTYTTVGAFDVSLTVSGVRGSDSLVRSGLIQTYEPQREPTPWP